MNKLPVELVEQIIADLYQLRGSKRQRWFAKIRLVCKLFSVLIRPYAFSDLHLNPGSPYLLTRLRLLCEDSSLRSLIKSIRLHVRIDSSFEPDPALTSMAKRVIPSLGIPDYLAKAISSTLPRGSGDAAVALGMALVERPIKLDLVMDDTTAQTLTAWMIRTRCLPDNTRTSTLRSLENVFLAGLSEEDFLRLDHWAFLLRLPCLTHFAAAGITGVSYFPQDESDGELNLNYLMPVFPPLQDINLDMVHLDMDVVDRLLRSSPALQSLKIGWEVPSSDERQLYFISMRCIGTLLRQNSFALRRLSLFLPGDAIFGMHHEYPMGDLSEFTCLQSLALSEWTVFGMPTSTYPDLVDRDRLGRVGPHQQKLVDMLPESIEKVEFAEDSIAPLEQDIAYMQQSEAQMQSLVDAARTKFVNLKLVMLEREIRVMKNRERIDTLRPEDWRVQPRGFRWSQRGYSYTKPEEKQFIDGLRTMQMDFNGLVRFQGWDAPGRTNVQMSWSQFMGM